MEFSQVTKRGLVLRVIIVVVLLYVITHSVYLMSFPVALPELAGNISHSVVDWHHQASLVDEFDCVLPQVREEYPRIVPFLLEYCRMHHNIRKNLHAVNRRFVVFKAFRTTGLGNRVSSLISAYLFALLSRRALIVSWLDEPVEYYLPNPKKDEEVSSVNFYRLFKYPGFAWDSTIVDVGYINVRLDGHEHYFSCLNYDDDPNPVVLIESWDYFLPLIAINPYYQRHLKEMFGDDLANGLFRPLALNLLRPLDRLQREIDAFILKHPVFIGIQVRTRGFFAMNTTEEVLGGIAECTQRIESEHSYYHKNLTHYMPVSPKWFLFTDNEIVREYFERHHENKTIFYRRKISRISLHGIEGALIDMFIAKEAKQLLVSHGSTFGKVIYGISGVFPYATTNEKNCTRKFDSDLCYWDNHINGTGKPYNELHPCFRRVPMTSTPWKERHDFNMLNGVRCQDY